MGVIWWVGALIGWFVIGPRIQDAIDTVIMGAIPKAHYGRSEVYYR